MRNALRLTRIDAAGFGAAALMTAGLYFAVVEPARRSQAAMSEQQELLDSVQGSLIEIEADRRALEETVARLDGQLSRYTISLQPVSRINARLGEITALAGEHGLKLSESRAGQTGVTGSIATVPVHISGAGGYVSFAGFLAELDRDFPDVAVTGFEVTGAPAQGPGGASAFSADLLWHASADGAGPAGSAGVPARNPR